jgi:ATP-dependent DNA helicase RecG
MDVADILSTELQYLPGVGPNRARMLNAEISVSTYRDLLYYFPYKYIDRSRIYRAIELTPDMPYVQLRGHILSFSEEGEGYKKRLVAHFTDGTSVVDLVWFQGLRFVRGKYKEHTEYIVFGKPTLFNSRFNIPHPDIDEVTSMQLSGMGLQPYYNTSDKMKRNGLTSNTIFKLIQKLLEILDGKLEETLTPALLQAHKLMPLPEAMKTVHHPADMASLQRAQYRLKFEELFFVQLNILRYAHDRLMKFCGIPFRKVGEHFMEFYNHHLPFPLTNAQKRVIKEIRTDMGSGKQMNRLLQGDVGSGKTLVALMCMLLAPDNGCQACLVAPTEILAEQHVATIAQFLEGMNIHVQLLTGQVKGKRRAEVLKGLADGSVQILVGTHAVFEDTVHFLNLGFVVIDEQHRFGVEQRAKLWSKNTTPPHVLVMTATPIPRTLAMTLYGDLDVSIIDELPPGRKPVKTLHCYESKRAGLNSSIRQQIEQGRQVYIVYPLIQESEKIDLKNLEMGYQQVCEVFPEYAVSKVHGKMKPAEKDAEMQRFVKGETQILVATTVIEVGVNVPNASVMIIENADRFGLSQLHQLRGRVGRGADQSYCILVTGFKLSETTRKRINIMVCSTNGFEIAEEDLKLRGPGDLEGTQQSGVAFEFRIANLARDGAILQQARDAASAILKTDPTYSNPANSLLWEQLRLLRKTHINWSAIS